MSFVAVLDSNKYKQLWSRCIISLASISDHIKFVITPETLSLSGVNSAKTSHAEIIFTKDCFHEYTVDFTDIVSEGFESQNDVDASYSFLINSKHLATLFKNLDANDLNYICFKIYWLVSAPSTMKFKLLIEIKTKKLIIKKYQTNYQPILKNSVDIAQVYKQEHRQNSINYIMIEQIIPKQFLDMIPSNTEDFKIDIKNEKILFSGYTKQILKDRECLKQPMAVTITLNLDELLSTNLSNSDRKSINFRLKEFKNFMNLISTLSDNDLGGGCFEIYFKHPGDPILFELNNQNVLVQYIQITAEDTEEFKRENQLELRPNIVQKVDVSSRAVQIDQPAPKRSTNRIMGKMNTDKNSRLLSYSTRTPEPSQNVPSSAEAPDIVTYGRETTPDYPSKRRNINNERRTIINTADTDYSDSENDKEMILGPTQLDNKPKSIFDV